MSFSLKTLGAAAFALVLGSAASAATLSIDGGVAGTIPDPTDSANQVLDGLGIGPSLDGFFESSISVDEDARVKVELFGFEAAFANSFNLGGFSLSKPAGQMTEVGSLGAPLASFSSDISAGTFAFNFTSVRNGGPDVVINNGDANNGPADFFASFGPGLETATSGSSLWLFFDDGGKGKNGIDDNHDDFVVRISVVPLPAGALLLLTGIAGLGFASRRKKA